jgi:hypothetical protein
LSKGRRNPGTAGATPYNTMLFTRTLAEALDERQDLRPWNSARTCG